ncbi:MAG: monofunctional biosynthetic peptidoglycan transglycosylase [Acidobacteria bacterium]|nr:monofunctional biosynthetic peptidoglycan transglycosylase [Acidobacteriota bacterium]
MKYPSWPRTRWKQVALVAASAIVGWYLICCALLVAYRWVNPPVTTVQMQRRIESWFSAGGYQSRQRRIPLQQIPRDLQRAVIAAEDGAFYEHSGVDWQEMQIVVDDARSGRRVRGGSTITQQLVKNLFLTTHSSVFRKLPEYALTPVAELVLSKDRILELYLNDIEWGPGVWGVGAAAQFHYNKPAERLSRNEAARLAACIPAPRTRRPSRMDTYSGTILERMRSRGW